MLSSCFAKYRTTYREVKRHYAHKTMPKVECIKNDTLCIQVASTGADTLPLLLLIHGAPGAWWGYMNMLDDTVLQKKFHIISVDRPGYGKSKLLKKRAVGSIEMQAQSLLNVFSLNHSKEPAIILGRSYGAPIAAKLATLAPEKVKQLIMVSPVIDPDKEKFYWFSRYGRNRLVQLFLPKEFNTATEEKYMHAEELRKMLPIWKKLTMPVTVIQGGQDWIGDPVNIEFAKKNIPSSHSQYITIQKAGHMLTFSHQEMIKEMLLRTNSAKSRMITLDLASGK
ncbi:alpha/beta fold hydrolase [Arundinibacter roseus]|nr:alpha/beta hydrolase [Arundinibacter roseus]